jgi:hypothetical protein
LAGTASQRAQPPRSAAALEPRSGVASISFFHFLPLGFKLVKCTTPSSSVNV